VGFVQIVCMFEMCGSSDNNVILNYSNPLGLKPSFSTFPHSNLTPDLLEIVLGSSAIHTPKLFLEVGSLHGHSAITLAAFMDMQGWAGVPLLCVDPGTGDVNMWSQQARPDKGRDFII
jgi:hypothetical protein